MPICLQQTELERSSKTTHSTLTNDADIVKIMVEYSRYISSEQVEKVRSDFAYGVHIRTPEPKLESASETSQPVTRKYLQPAVLKRKRKRKRNNTNVLCESESHNTSLEPGSDVAVETPQPTILGLTLSAPPTQEQKRIIDFSGEPEPDKNPPELELAPGLETHQPITRSSSQPPSPKRKRKSKMLRELQPHNKSPEHDSGPDIGMLHESTKEPYTRRAAHEVTSFLKDQAPIPAKSLNVDRLMYTELSGIPKGTKTWYFPENENPGSSSQQRQPESRQGIEVKIKEEDEEEILGEHLLTSDRSCSQSKLTRRTISKQSTNSSGKSQQRRAVALETPWSMWDREKGQSALNLHLLHRYFKASYPCIYINTYIDIYT